MHHSDEREGLGDVFDVLEKEKGSFSKTSSPSVETFMSGNDEDINLLEEFEKRGKEVEEEEKAEPASKTEVEARLRKALQEPKGATIGGEVGKVGTTGLFPGGKLTAKDKGQLGFQIGHTKDNKKVIFDFGRPVTWIGFTPAEAFSISKALRKHAKKCRP